MGFIGPTQLSFEMINTDIAKLQGMINSACGGNYYAGWHNPITEKGELILNDSMICIKIPKRKKCLLTLCDTNVTEVIDLSDIIYINVVKYHQNDTFAIWGDDIPVNTTYVSPFNITLGNETENLSYAGE